MTLKECRKALGDYRKVLLLAGIEMCSFDLACESPSFKAMGADIARLLGCAEDCDPLDFMQLEYATMLNGEAPEPAHEARRPTPLEAKIAEVAGCMKARHPACRSCGIAEITKKLKVIVARHKLGKIGMLEEIDANHAGWCALPQWQKMGPDGQGHFARGLANWLAPTEERYLEPPPPPVANCRAAESKTVRAMQIYLGGKGDAA